MKNFLGPRSACETLVQHRAQGISQSERMISRA